MPEEKKKRINVKRYKPPPAHGPPDYSVEVVCTICGRRACDLSDYPPQPLWVGMKCPHCHNIVHLQCTAPELNNTS